MRDRVTNILQAHKVLRQRRDLVKRPCHGIILPIDLNNYLSIWKHLPLAQRTFRKFKTFGKLLALCLLPCVAKAQFSNLRERVVDARLPLQRLDSLTVVTPLLSVSDVFSGQKMDARFFSLENNWLRTDTAALRSAFPDCSKILVRYRVLPFNLAAKISRLDTAAIRRRMNADAIEFDYEPYQPTKPLWEQSGLSSSGAYTRGLSFGNSQNLVFNSNLNLQLNGKLGNDLELTAALSDNSIPLQPDGTTRQLQEFDRIFIQLKRKNATLTAGDFDLARPDGYFSNYFKRLQGAMVTVESYKLKVPPSSAPARRGSAGGKASAGKSSKLKVSKPQPKDQTSSNIPISQYPNITLRAAAAISRGKFARQTIQGQEGNQGPYRLQGAEGERFIIVLAGTEKVYADGQLLRRGQEDDYTVDYNLGELTFTPRRLITKDIRIIVEFEYAVQTYLRSTVAANSSWQMPRAKVFFNLYSEQDSRNNGGAQELSSSERSRLAQVGDDLQNAYAPGIDTLAAFDPARVLYSLIDTVLCGQPRQILTYSTHPDSARYAARFTEVPAGQGNYVLAKTAANGRVFRWSPPDPVTCRPTGNFEPIVRLVAPETRQLYALGGDFQPFKNSKIQAEIALSSRDLNRFSPLGNADNVGAAAVVGWRQGFGFGKCDTNLTNFKNLSNFHAFNGAFFANYEFAARDFRPLNPYRPAEFSRDWNVGLNQDTTAEHLAKAGISLKKNKLGEVRYEFGAFRREGFYGGARHSGGWRVQRAGWDFLGEANLLQTDGQAERTRFSRPKADLSKTFFAKNDSAAQRALLKIGLYAEREKNARRAAQADTLSAASFWYDLLRVYFQTPENQGAWQFGGHLSQRNDFAPLGNLFQQNTEAREFNLNGSWNNSAARAPKSPNPQIPPASVKTSTSVKTSADKLAGKKSTNQQLTWILTLRRLRILAPELTKEEPQNTYLGRADYSLSAWKNVLGFTTGYELGSGQSPRIEFNYLAVNPGEGNFTWVDRNRDSILQVDEMEIAVFQDQANYVRVAVTTPDYVRTNNVALNQTLRLEPRLLWPTARRGWRKRLGRLSTQSTLQINRRSFSGSSGVRAWDPFQTSIADTALATLSQAVRNILFINRAQPAWDASLSAGDNRSQLALTTGFEQRRAQDYALHLRANLSRRWSAEADFVNSLKSSENQAFVSRNYQIEGWEIGPKMTWLPIRGFRMVANMKWETSRNTLPAAERADQTNWTAELTWNPASKANAQGFKAATSLRLKGTFANVHYTGSPNSAVAFAMLEGLQDGKNFLWNLTLDRQLSKAMQLSLNYEGRKTGENRVVHVARAQVRAVF